MSRATELQANDVMAFTGPGGRQTTILFSDLIKLGAALQYLADRGTIALPGMAFNGDLNTGVMSKGADQMSLVAGALDCINISETAAAREIGFYVTAPIPLQTGVAASGAGVHAALVALGLITA